MKALFILGALLLPITSIAATAVPMQVEIKPIRAEPVVVPPPGATTVAPPSEGEGITPIFLEIDGVKGETTSGKGNVDMQWKVEKGEKMMEEDDESVTPDFAILLGGGNTDKNTGLARALEVLEENAKASDQAIESVSLNFEKITTKIKHEVKLLGFIPVSATVTVDVDELAHAEVRYPWWAFLASGRDSELVGARVVSTLSNVLKTKHDAIKNAIQNVR